MPTYVVKAINVPTISGNVTWYCVIQTSTGNEVCRSVNESDATRISTLLMADEV